MALNKNETARPDTCALLSQLAGSGFPVGYARIHSWRINPTDPSFEALLALYYDEATRNESPANCAYYSVGGHITPETLAAIQSADDRSVFYKAIEYFIHFQMYRLRLQTIDDDEYISELEEKQAALEQLDDDLGINLSTSFFLVSEMGR
jgi:hypothetical protein